MKGQKKNIMSFLVLLILIVLIVMVIVIYEKRNNNTTDIYVNTLLSEEEIKKEIGARINSDKISGKITNIVYNQKNVTVLGTINKIEDGKINLNGKIDKSIYNDEILYLVGYGLQPSASVYLYLLTKNKDVYYINYKTYGEFNSDNITIRDKLDITNVDRLILADIEITYEESNEMYGKGDKVKSFKAYAEKDRKLYDLSEYSNIPRGY